MDLKDFEQFEGNAEATQPESNAKPGPRRKKTAKKKSQFRTAEVSEKVVDSPEKDDENPTFQKTIPLCSKHYVQMKCDGSRVTAKNVRHANYVCPVPGCDEKSSTKNFEPLVNPVYCIKNMCGKVAKQFSDVKSDANHIALVCPTCGHTSMIVRPELTQNRVRRTKKMDFSANRKPPSDYLEL